MPDREKVIENVEYAFDVWIDEYEGTSYYDIEKVKQAKDDALALLKEQEHKDKMFHALEEDWKRLKELLKEQEAVKPTWSRGKPFCGACGLRIHGGKFCNECGRPVLWEGR